MGSWIDRGLLPCGCPTGRGGSWCHVPALTLFGGANKVSMRREFAVILWVIAPVNGPELPPERIRDCDAVLRRVFPRTAGRSTSRGRPPRTRCGSSAAAVRCDAVQSGTLRSTHVAVRPSTRPPPTGWRRATGRRRIVVASLAASMTKRLKRGTVGKCGEQVAEGLERGAVLETVPGEGILDQATCGLA